MIDTAAVLGGDREEPFIAVEIESNLDDVD